jgi:hypothetical protein
VRHGRPWSGAVQRPRDAQGLHEPVGPREQRDHLDQVEQFGLGESRLAQGGELNADRRRRRLGELAGEFDDGPGPFVQGIGRRAGEDVLGQRGVLGQLDQAAAVHGGAVAAAVDPGHGQGC